MEGKTFDFLAATTAVVVLFYLAGMVWAASSGAITWDKYAEDIKGPALLLLGYWVRGAAK